MKLSKEPHVLALDGRVLIEDVEMALQFRARLKGLLGRDSLPEGRALCIFPCNCIHSFGMRFKLDLFFLGGRYEITKLVWDLAPGRMVFGGVRARIVIEMQSGWFPRDLLHAGDRISLAPAGQKE